MPVLDQEGNVQLNNEVVFSVDSSGSMISNDRNDIRITASQSFVSKMAENDKGAVVDFDDYAHLLASMTSDKPTLNNALDEIDKYGGTNLSAGFSLALEQYSNEDANRLMIFLTDGDGTWNSSLIDLAIEKNVTVYTVGLGTSYDATKLVDMATRTGGLYFPAQNADELIEILDAAAEDSVLLTKDSDGDGIPDYYEINGLVSGTGNLIKTDPNNDDTDEDDISDGDEITFDPDQDYVTPISDPNKKDSDGDGIPDSGEKPNEKFMYNVTDEALAVLSDLAYIDVETHSTSEEQAKGLEDLSKDVEPLPLSKDSIQNKIRLDSKADLVDDWEIIGYEVGGVSGHYGIVFRDSATHSIVIAERGSEMDKQGQKTDWLITNVDIIVDGDNPQLDNALSLTKNAIYKNLYSDIFVTGHSLGGFNAQVISYHLINKTLTKNNPLSSKKSKEIYKAVENNYQRTATFNSAPLFKSDTLDKIGIQMDIYTNPEIPIEEIGNEKYDNHITNYQLSYDILTLAGQYLDAGYIGKVNMFDYKVNGKVKNLEDAKFEGLKALIEGFKKVKYTDKKGNYEEPFFDHRVELLLFLKEFKEDWLEGEKVNEFETLNEQFLNDANEAHAIEKFDNYEF